MSTKPIYRGFDKADLDREYSPSSLIGDVAPYIDAYATTSAAARRDLACEIVVRYGSSTAETLDFFRAPRAPAPLMVFVHGGYWQEVASKESSFAAADFVDAGAAFAAVNYALAPAVSMDEIVRQTRAAIAWVWAEADALGVDRERIHISGHSAGAHLVAMALATDWVRDFTCSGLHLRGATAVSGIYDLTPIRLTYVDAPLGLDDASVVRNSPIHHLAPASRAAALILTYGEIETDEFKRQTHAFGAAWLGGGRPCRFFAVPERNHFDVILDLGRRGTQLGDAVRAQMDLA